MPQPFVADDFSAMSEEELQMEIQQRLSEILPRLEQAAPPGEAAAEETMAPPDEMTAEDLSLADLRRRTLRSKLIGDRERVSGGEVV